MTVLIVFATVEGQTRKIAMFVRDQCVRAGHDVMMLDADQGTRSAPLASATKVILAASVHERRHAPAFEDFIRQHHDELAARQTLLLSVSLSAAFPEGHEEADDYLVEMKMRTKFEPAAEALIAGAVQTSKYDYFATQVVRHVVLRDRNFDPSAREHEFTDWSALAGTIARFLEAEAPAKAEVERLPRR